MCGIVGAVTQRRASGILLEGLQRLEYRGYDSAGLVVFGKDKEIHRVRRVGKVKELKTALAETRIEVGGDSAVQDPTARSFKLAPQQVLVLLAGLGLALALLLLARRALPHLPIKKIQATLSTLAIRWRALRKPALANRLNPGNSAED